MACWLKNNNVEYNNLNTNNAIENYKYNMNSAELYRRNDSDKIIKGAFYGLLRATPSKSIQGVSGEDYLNNSKQNESTLK